jgi:hypothetical protein
MLDLGFEVGIIDEQAEQLLPLDIHKLLKHVLIDHDTDINFTKLALHADD